MPSSTDPIRRALLGCLAALVLLAFLPGCNILGPALYLVSDSRDPSMYKLDPKRSAVVFIDDRASVLPARALRARIAKAAEKEILGHKLLDVDLISSDSLQEVILAERFSKPRSIAEIGRAVQAEQVIYATIDAFTLSPDGSQFSPTATLRVKVIDSKNDTRLFPVESAPGAGGGKELAFTLSVPEKVRATALPRSTTEILKAQQELADEIGRKLGEVFFKHSSTDPNSPVGR